MVDAGRQVIVAHIVVGCALSILVSHAGISFCTLLWCADVGEKEVEARAALQVAAAPAGQLLSVPERGGGNTSGVSMVTRAHTAAPQHNAAAGNERQANNAVPADRMCSGLQLLFRLAVGQCGSVFLGRCGLRLTMCT